MPPQHRGSSPHPDTPKCHHDPVGAALSLTLQSATTTPWEQPSPWHSKVLPRHRGSGPYPDIPKSTTTPWEQASPLHSKVLPRHRGNNHHHGTPKCHHDTVVAAQARDSTSVSSSDPFKHCMYCSIRASVITNVRFKSVQVVYK